MQAPASPACLNAARGQPADAKVAENLETITAIPRHALGKADRKALVLFSTVAAPEPETIAQQRRIIR
jgi:hypothetical protein